MKKKFSIVVPVYKNEMNIEDTVETIIQVAPSLGDYEVELIMVCDGSPDKSYEEMKKCQKKYPDFLRIACFTRNFGQGAAVRCGIEMATGDVIGVISCDLQDPVILFRDMLQKWENGALMVIGEREQREDMWFTTLCSNMFHKFINRYVESRYPKGGFDIYLLDRKVAEDFCEIDAPNGSTQLCLLWLGYDYEKIYYKRLRRKKGKSSWNFKRKLVAAVGLVVTYSNLLVRIIEMMGLACIFVPLLYIVVCATCRILGNSNLPMSNAVFFTMLAGMILLSIGIVGEYAWRVYYMVLKRPRYVLKSKCCEEIGRGE